ncbi:hypothetical protein [Gilvimarinus sp. DA14]|uniref:hypothetical protein n=1 Tax=Gilvimarinus sp. DA14 TaxID=2956798 RepID=UPI0020B68DA8|nr:hypothetical protein [Gilvimarinus sp. DA14]UTF60274.1 hypothetical protein NHM04_00330 [Gilvimarinus sp. DA14]
MALTNRDIAVFIGLTNWFFGTTVLRNNVREDGKPIGKTFKELRALRDKYDPFDEHEHPNESDEEIESRHSEFWKIRKSLHATIYGRLHDYDIDKQVSRHYKLYRLLTCGKLHFVNHIDKAHRSSFILVKEHLRKKNFLLLENSDFIGIDYPRSELLNLITLRALACAMLVDRYIDDRDLLDAAVNNQIQLIGVKSSITDKTRNLAKKFLDSLRADLGTDYVIDTSEIERLMDKSIAHTDIIDAPYDPLNGERLGLVYPEAFRATMATKRDLMVREIILNLNLFCILKSSSTGRFPPAVIVELLNIVDPKYVVEIPHLNKIQARYDAAPLKKQLETYRKVHPGEAGVFYLHEVLLGKARGKI